jgi:type I restriction enzyme S subunit
MLRPVPGEAYRQIGVRLWGQGAYERETVDGANTKYAVLNRVATDDIIVNKIWARNGSVSVVPPALDGCLCSGEFPLFEPLRDRLEPRWFYWITKTRWFWERCDRQSRGTSGKNRIRPEAFLQIEIPLPPLPEQRRIVARLDQLSAKVAEARRLRRSNAESGPVVLDTACARIMASLLAAGTMPISEAVTFERGRFSHRPRNDPRFFGGSHPWIQIAEIESATKYVQSWSTTLNDQGLAISRKFPRGTVLISIAATIGAVAILDFDCCVPDSVVAALPHDGIHPEFLYYYLSNLRSHLGDIAPQSAQKNINLRILSELPFPRVTEAVQSSVVWHLDALADRIAALSAQHHLAERELQALTPAIFDRAFRGKL